MIQIKNLFDRAEPEDGIRLWIGAVNLTKDLAAWCKVDRWFREGAPSADLAAWFEEHPDGWEYFRGKHHEALARNGFAPVLRHLSRRALDETVTLLHAETDATQNAAVSLYEYLVELQAHCSDE